MSSQNPHANFPLFPACCPTVHSLPSFAPIFEFLLPHSVSGSGCQALQNFSLGQTLTQRQQQVKGVCVGMEAVGFNRKGAHLMKLGALCALPTQLFQMESAKLRVSAESILLAKSA